MWLILLTAITFIVVTLLLAPLRVVCTWEGRHIEIRLKFVGLSYKVWRHQLFGRGSHSSSGERAKTPADIVTTAQDTIARIQAVIDNWEVVVDTGRIGLRLFRRSRHWIHFESGAVEVVIGGTSPAVTGISIGGVSTLGGLFMARWPQMTVSCRPDFDIPSLHSSGRIVVRMRVWDLVWNLTLAAARLPWRGLRKLKADLAFS